MSELNETMHGVEGPDPSRPKPRVCNLELVATTPIPIVAMCVHRDLLLESLGQPGGGQRFTEICIRERLFVATTEGVFERDEDGVFRQCRFEKADPS